MKWHQNSSAFQRSRLAALTHKTLDDITSFRPQIALAVDDFWTGPEGLASHREFDQALSCDAKSVAFRSSRLKGPIRQNGQR
jgi:hypothetical protein